MDDDWGGPDVPDEEMRPQPQLQPSQSEAQLAEAIAASMRPENFGGPSGDVAMTDEDAELARVLEMSKNMR